MDFLLWLICPENLSEGRSEIARRSPLAHFDISASRKAGHRGLAVPVQLAFLVLGAPGGTAKYQR